MDFCLFIYFILVVPSRVAGQLEDLNGEVRYDCSQVYTGHKHRRAQSVIVVERSSAYRRHPILLHVEDVEQ